KFDQADTPMKQALFAYNGSVFKTMQTDTIPVADLDYIQDHLRIVSVLYGLLRPLDLIKAYRLAYTLKLKG
ncbi:MAG: peroxide stress protein YaaA, partial [Odoribacter splanchnicus]